MTDIETVTHVAGHAVKFGNRTLQRCLICGEKLVDTADPDTIQTPWPEWTVVKQEHGYWHSNKQNFLKLKQLPEDICLNMVE